MTKNGTMKNMFKKKGAVTMTTATLIAGGTILASVLVSYFGSQLATYDKIAEVKEEVKKEIVIVDKDVVENTTNIASMKADISEIKIDVKSLLRAFNVK